MTAQEATDSDQIAHTKSSGRRSDEELYSAHLIAAERVKIRIMLRNAAKEPHGKKLVRAINHLHFVIDHFLPTTHVSVAAADCVEKLIEAVNADAKGKPLSKGALRSVSSNEKERDIMPDPQNVDPDMFA